MNKDYVTIGAYDGLRKAERIMDEKGLDYLIVLNEGKLTGILTTIDICKSHPNRIVSDAISDNIVTASSGTSLWDAKLLFEKHLINELLVVDYDELAGVVTNTKLYSELGKHYDQLTGLFRSDYIYYHGIKLMEKGVEISVIFVDLDRFGQIDKEYGHVQGNYLLQEVAKVMKSFISKDAYLCRFGGDEFAIIVPYKLEKSKIFAENLFKAISSYNFPLGLSITASIGIAGGRRNDARAYDAYDMISDLINLASLASTKAKRENRKLAIADRFYSSEVI